MRYKETRMRQFRFFAVAVAVFATLGSAQDGPYKVLKTARVGGEGGWDYIYADAAGRKLYIPRGATRAVPATATTPEVPAVEARLTVFDLDTLKPAGDRRDRRNGRGRSQPGHGFTSDHPAFDVRHEEMALITH